MDLLQKFKLAELTQLMIQKDDATFIHLVNKVRVGDVDESVESLFYSRFINKDDELYPTDIFHRPVLTRLLRR